MRWAAQPSLISSVLLLLSIEPGMGESRSLVILGELQRLPTIGELP